MDLSDRICSGLISLSIDPVPLLVSRLEQYLWLIAKWNKVTNLTAIDDPVEMVTVHLLDSLAIYPYLTGRRVLDVGSGAGLPGIPLALLCSDKDFILLDSNGKKTRFMTQATIELELTNVTVIQSRIESFEGSFDHITCRAFQSTAEFAQQCGRLLVPGGSLLAMKGPAESQPSEVPGFRQSIHSLQVPGLSSQRYLVELHP